VTGNHSERHTTQITTEDGTAGRLVSAILRHPGPVLSAATTPSVFEATSGIRAQRGSVHVFNPEGTGGVASTVRWNPLDGCQDLATAIRRAIAFAQSVGQRGAEGTGFWAGKASDYLRACFYAAAAEGLDLTCVARWITGNGSTEAEQILNGLPSPGRQWAAQLTELRGEANMTTRTIRMTMSRALAFLADPLAGSVLPAAGQSLDLETFLREAGTLYLIGGTRGDDSPVAPLFACLASELHHTAALASSQMPGGRLDPPFLIALDEVTQICPVRFPSWLDGSGGTGIQIITADGEAQLRSGQGRDGARALPARQQVRNTYSARLATRITPGVDTRLRQLALVRRRRINHVLDEVLDAALPTAADLITQMTSLSHDEEEPRHGRR
jgi:type IV secretion system protein VirD4